MCSGSSYLRLVDCVYHSTPGLRVFKKKKRRDPTHTNSALTRWGGSPNPFHFQNYDLSMSQLSSGSEGCSPKMCADQVTDEDEGQVWRGGWITRTNSAFTHCGRSPRSARYDCLICALTALYVPYDCRISALTVVYVPCGVLKSRCFRFGWGPHPHELGVDALGEVAQIGEASVAGGHE